MDDNMILEMENISKSFPGVNALSNVNLAVRRGTIHALMGENGAGKSTLMKILDGLYPPDRGQIIFQGQTVTVDTTRTALKLGISMIHQELSPIPHMSVAENIFLGREPLARFGMIDKSKMEADTRALLERLEIDLNPTTLMKELSVANTQMVEIAKAISFDSSLIIMDEPTSAITEREVAHLFSLIRSLKAKNVSIIYITHKMDEVFQIADDVTVLRDGKSVSTGKIKDVTDSFLISQMVGRSVDNLYPKRAPYAGESETMLEVKDLTLPPTVKSATFKLKRGEVFGIAGLMGAGRTEMARAIFGIDKPTSGTLTLKREAMPASGGNPALRLLQGIGYLSEDRKSEGLALRLSIADNITITRYGACSRFGWLDEAKQQSISSALMQTLDVRAKSSVQPVQTLSGGNQQKVAIARLLHQKADILLLDEPTRGIDIGSKATIYETIADLANQGKAIILISSYLPELFGMCDRLAVMTRGRLSIARPIDEWTPELVLEIAINSDTDKTNGH